MRLALLGSDETTAELVREVAARTEHEIVWACELELREAEVRSATPGLKIVEHWELLLGGTVADAVIVARHTNEELRVEQLRKLLQAGVPTLVMHPICHSMLLAYELEMIRADTKTIILPYLPNRLRTVVATLAAMLSKNEADEMKSTVGRVEQILFERVLADRSKESVVRQFATDVDLLQAICGELNRISAHGGPIAETAYANLAVQMSGAAEIPVRWTMAPVANQPGGQLTVVGANGRVVVHMPGDAFKWQLEQTGENQPTKVEAGDWSPVAAMLLELEQAISGTPSRSNCNPISNSATWSEACRDIEMAETIDRCLKRGRTVDLHHEDFTEENTFKGTMTSLGCGLLVGGVSLAFAVAIAQGICKAFGWRAGAELFSKWPYLLLGCLFLFLVLQGLLVLTKKPDDAEELENK
jgi:myo-inositol 2-dehydrogenase/D-chiro-inositol 1-dehydrogenase